MTQLDFAAEFRPAFGFILWLRQTGRAFTGLVAAYRARRARRLALRTLLEMEPYRLNDLGIEVGDVLDALEDDPRAR